MNSLNILRNFPLYGKKETLFNLLSMYELYKDTIERPGDIVIIGNNIASSLITFANFSESQTIGDRTRLVYGFDSYKQNEEFNSENEYYNILDTSINIYNKDRFVGWKDRIIYNNANITKFKSFIDDNIGLKISLLYCIDLEDDKKKIEEMVSPYLIKKAKIVFNKR